MCKHSLNTELDLTAMLIVCHNTSILCKDLYYFMVLYQMIREINISPKPFQEKPVTNVGRYSGVRVRFCDSLDSRDTS